MTKKLLIPLMICLAILFVVAVGAVYSLHQKMIHENGLKRIAEIEVDLLAKFEEQQKMMAAIAKSIALSDTAKKLMQQNDRSALQNRYLDFFQELKAHYGITHLYFIDPEGNVILRVHNPEVYGDKLTRNSIAEVIRQKDLVQSIEQGILGELSYRTILPLKDKDKHVGFVELGTELFHLLEAEKNLDFVLLASKNFVKKDIWDRRKEFSKSQGNWDDFKDFLRIGGSIPEIDSNLSHFIAGLSFDNNVSAVELNTSSQAYLIKPLTIKNAKGTPAAILLLLYPQIHGSWFTNIIALLLVIAFLAIAIYAVKLVKRIFDIINEQQLTALTHSRLATLGEMTASIAHEVNSPLAVIMGRSDQLLRLSQENKLDGSEVKKISEIIINTSRRISKTIKGIQRVSRNAENDPFSPTKIITILNDAVDLVAERFRVGDVKIFIECDEKLEADCRSTQICQVILNLLNNAFDAISNSTDRWVKIAVSDESPSLLIRIIDSGKGIPEQVAQRLMEPFYTTKDSGKGTGLGLSISKRIIEQHQGRFYYDSQCSNTTFVIELPKRAAQSKAA